MLSLLLKKSQYVFVHIPCSVVLFSSIDETEDGEQIVTNVLPARIKKMFSDITGTYVNAYVN